MKVYKIKHIPTGLYFTPNKGSGNFSAKGKIYTSLPSLKWLDKNMRIIFYKESANRKVNRILIEHFDIDIVQPRYVIDELVKVPLTDWEIIEID